MKRILILTILLMLVLVGYRSPYVQEWLEQGADYIQNQAEGYNKKFQISRESMMDELGAFGEQLGDQERIYINKISRNKTELQRFVSSYCNSGDYNPILVGDHLQQVCLSARSLLNKSLNI